MHERRGRDRGRKGLAHDGADRDSTPPALRAAPKGFIDLGRRAGTLATRLEARPYGPVRENVAGTDNHLHTASDAGLEPSGVTATSVSRMVPSMRSVLP